MLIEEAGYKGKYINKVMATGYATNEIESFIKQRKRWASGCIQMDKKYKILKQKGLNKEQKSEYILCVSYWLFPIKQMIYLILPALYAIFNMIIIKSSMRIFLLMWLPQYIIKRIVLDKIYKNLRSSTWNKIYEIILSPALIIQVIKEILGRKNTKFEVSKKETTNNSKEKIEIKLLIFHIVFLILNLISVIICITRIEKSASIIMSLIWSLSNIWYLLVAIIFDKSKPKNVEIKKETKKALPYKRKALIHIFTRIISERKRKNEKEKNIETN